MTRCLSILKPWCARLVALTPVASLVMVAVLIGSVFGPAQRSQAALLGGNENPDILIGLDNDNVNNPIIQPPGVTANQSLNNADVLAGRGGNDVLAGLGGSDVLTGARATTSSSAGRNRASPPTATSSWATRATTSASGPRATAAICSSAGRGPTSRSSA